MIDFKLSEESLGYVTSQDVGNTDIRFLVAGSQNVLIDYQLKTKTRSGYSLLGDTNTALTANRNAWTWKTSKGQNYSQRFYDDELEVYLGTVDGVEVNAWKRIANGWSTTERMRQTTWWDVTEGIDVQLMVVGDDKIYEWSGGVAVVDSVTETVTEAGDASNQLSAWSILGTTSDNTNAFVLYYGLTNSGTTRTVDVYKDSAGGASDKVATGTVDGDGTITLAEANSSGITGSVTVAYTGDDVVAAANTLTMTFTIKKAGTTTFKENHFYDDAGSTRTLINVRTGTEFSYTGGEGTTTLTGVTGSPVTDGMVAGDVLVQKVVTNDNEPLDTYNNHFIHNINNQIVIGSEDDNRVFMSANDDYTDYTASSPRTPGEGETFTLDSPCNGLASLGEVLVIGAGKSRMYKVVFTQREVNSVLTESAEVKRLTTGAGQGFLCQEAIVPLGDAIAYLTNEVAVRIITDPDTLTGVNPKTFSNPIKPDFDAEDWFDSNNVPQAFGIWYKNTLYFSAPEASHLYMLNFKEDADGKTKRYWNPPQILPVGPMSLIDLEDGDGDVLYGHSNSVPETYKLFDGGSDRFYSGIATVDKLPFKAKAVFAYNNYKKKGRLKTFDEYFVEGEITPNTIDLTMTLDYDYGGATQTLEKTIDGSDEDILEGTVEFNSLAQQSLAVNPLGGLLNPPSNARRFRKIFEIPKEDFFEIRTTFETNEVDRYFAIIAHGANATLSPRKPINLK